MDHPWRAGGNGIRVLQFTDTHLFADAGGLLGGMNTLRTMQAVLAHARQHCWPPDLVLATGDLIHDDSRAAYERFYAAFSDLDNIPVHCLPGNHDIPTLMHQVLNRGNLHCSGFMRQGPWQIVLLDTTVAGSACGHLGAPTLGHLETCLRDHPELYALVCLHHPPVYIDSPWMDDMAVDNAEDLFAIIDRYPQVRGVLWGHIHQAYEAERKGVRLLGSPSTCIQFQPRSVELALDAEPPGYRWLALRPDGGLDSGVLRIAAENLVSTT